MSHGIVIAAWLQLFLAASFVAMALAARRYGDAAQRAIEANATRQGVDPQTLARHRVDFRESLAELILPLAIALILALLGVVNVAGYSIGRTASLGVQPVLLAVGGAVTVRQVFASRYLKATFEKSADAALHAVDVDSMVRAGLSAFPSAFRYLVVVRFVLTTAGSAAIIALLATA